MFLVGPARNCKWDGDFRPRPAGQKIWPLMAKKKKALNGRDGREIIKMASPMAGV